MRSLINYLSSAQSSILLTLIASLLLPLQAHASISNNNKSNCKEVAFNVSGTAQNRVIPSDILSLPLANLTALLEADDFQRTTVSGYQIIAGWYCQPSVTNANNDKLQVFSASITTNRDSFTAQGGTALGFPAYQPENYSWIRYAGNLGYPTLALDRLGNGLSSAPDPILVAQGPYEYALFHSLVQQIKTGTTGQLPRSYTSLIFVGNSYGSVTGNNIAALHPDDFEQYVLTGFTKSVLPSLPGVSLVLPVPAAVHDPARFGHLPLGYLTPSSETGRTNSFFGSKAQAAFDPEVAHLFYTREDTVSVGDFISTYVDIVEAPAYKGRVLVLQGEHDQAFCGPGSPVIGPAHCRSLLPDTGGLFPNAEYNYYSVAESGHALILHLSHAETLDIAHRFLAGEKFAHSISGIPS